MRAELESSLPDVDGDRRAAVLVVGADCRATRAIAASLRLRLGEVRVLFEDPVPFTSALKSRVRRQGVARTLGQVALQLTVPIQRWLRRMRIRQLELALPSDFEDAWVLGTVASMNSPEARRIIRGASPAIVVVSGTRILGRKTLACGPRFVNMHSGLTPMFRGVHGGYWAMVSGRPAQFGVTVHYVDEGVDTGQVIHQASGAPSAADGYVTFPLLQLQMGLPGLVDTVEALAQGRAPEVWDTSGRDSRQYYHPTLAEFVANGLRTGVW